MVVAARLTRFDQRGFTLPELLIAVAIIGLVMGGIVILLTAGATSCLTGSNQVGAQSTIRFALDRMTRELREAGYNPNLLPPCTPGPVPPACLDPVINATATQFTIQNDWNRNRLIEPGVVFSDTCSWGDLPTSHTSSGRASIRISRRMEARCPPQAA